MAKAHRRVQTREPICYKHLHMQLAHYVDAKNPRSLVRENNRPSRIESARQKYLGRCPIESNYPIGIEGE